MAPMARPYRWETLRKLREEACDAAAAALAARANERAAAVDALARAKALCEEAETRIEAHRDRVRREQGKAFTGAEWQRAQDFERRLKAEAKARGRVVTETRARLAEAERQEEAARATLVEAKQELEVLERDRAKVEAEARRQAERREEAEAEDQVAARWERK